MLAYKNVAFSACLMAKVLGIFSPKIKRVIVPAAVAIATPLPCPNKSTKRAVAIDANPTFTRLLPKRIVGRNFSAYTEIKNDYKK